MAIELCGCFVSHRSAGIEDPDIIDFCPLHAAAPEMLAALKEIRDYPERHYSKLLVKDAIAKAEGGKL